jgi:hypothetical protein
VKEVAMTDTVSRPVAARRKPRPSAAVRRFGYLVAALINAAMLYAINVWPGWTAVPFLTVQTEDVLPAVNASLVAGILANALYLWQDPKWLRELGNVVTTSVGLFAMIRLWVVFPVEFPAAGFDWALIVRILLALGIVGSIVGILAGLFSFGRTLAHGEHPPSEPDHPSTPQRNA